MSVLDLSANELWDLDSILQWAFPSKRSMYIKMQVPHHGCLITQPILIAERTTNDHWMPTFWAHPLQTEFQGRSHLHTCQNYGQVLLPLSSRKWCLKMCLCSKLCFPVAVPVCLQHKVVGKTSKCGKTCCHIPLPFNLLWVALYLFEETAISCLLLSCLRWPCLFPLCVHDTLSNTKSHSWRMTFSRRTNSSLHLWVSLHCCTWKSPLLPFSSRFVW